MQIIDVNIRKIFIALSLYLASQKRARDIGSKRIFLHPHNSPNAELRGAILQNVEIKIIKIKAKEAVKRGCLELLYISFLIDGVKRHKE